MVAVVFDGGVYVLCWGLCCVVVNPHKSGSYFRFSGLPVRPQVFLFSVPQFALVILLLLLAGRSMRVELESSLRFGRFLPFESRSSTTINSL